MTKIGIVTIHNADNYGAVLQAYALNRFIKKQHEEPKVYTIDYNNQHITKEYHVIRTGLTPRRILKTCHDILMINNTRRKTNKFKQFRANNLDLTAREYFDFAQLSSSQEKFNIYISGSDQIWNPRHSNHDVNGVYYLDFAPENAKRISYASSFGHYDFNNEQKKQIKQYLSKYASISCRETDGVELIREVAQREAEHVLDPVFLLTEDEWKSLLVSNEEPKENYLLVYTLGFKNRNVFEIAQKIAQNKKLKIYHLATNMISNKCVDHKINDAGPIDFLHLFSKASYIVTTSFHGTAFSILFNKNFVSVPPNNKENSINRVKSLLSLLGLEDRIISKVDELEKLPLELDYTQSNIYLQQQREKSITYLRNALGEQVVC